MTTRKKYAVLSGEGDHGIRETVTTTERGIKMRLRREMCGGDRWAWAIEMENGETADEAIDRGRCLGQKIEVTL